MKLPTGIVVEDGLMAFGNFEVKDKIKVNDFEHGGSTYSLRSHDQVTRLEKNGELLIETVPGATVYNFKEQPLAFDADMLESLQVTLGLQVANASVNLVIDGLEIDGAAHGLKTNASGKLSFSLEKKGHPRSVTVLIPVE